MVATILSGPRIQAVNVVVVTCASATIGEDGPCQQVRFAMNKKASFDIETKKEMFFQAKHAIGRNPGKFPIVEMPSSFDPSIEAGPLRQHGTLQ